MIARGGAFEVVDFQIGRTNDEFSRLTLKVSAATPSTLQHLVEDLIPLGCHLVGEEDAVVRTAERDRSVPDDFYSTTNLRTHVRVDGRWIEVERQRMDAVIVIEDGRAVCRKLRDIRTGDRVVCGLQGLRVSPEFRERDRADFGFMSNDISSERRVEATVVRIAALLHDTRRLERRIVFVAGPVVVHTGGAAYLSELIRAGWVDVVLAGNALAVHDVELELFGTSLGVDLESGVPVQGGHRHHMRAINAINRAGGIRGAVQSGVISRGSDGRVRARKGWTTCSPAVFATTARSSTR